MPIFNSPLIGDIELTLERKLHITSAHPDLKMHINKLTQILKSSDAIQRSKIDKNVLLFYKYYARIKSGKYMCVAVKTNERNFVLTAYLTDKIKAGESYEKKEKSI